MEGAQQGSIFLCMCAARCVRAARSLYVASQRMYNAKGPQELGLDDVRLVVGYLQYAQQII